MRDTKFAERFRDVQPVEHTMLPAQRRVWRLLLDQRTEDLASGFTAVHDVSHATVALDFGGESLMKRAVRAPIANFVATLCDRYPVGKAGFRGLPNTLEKGIAFHSSFLGCSRLTSDG